MRNYINSSSVSSKVSCLAFGFISFYISCFFFFLNISPAFAPELLEETTQTHNGAAKTTAQRTDTNHTNRLKAHYFVRVFSKIIKCKLTPREAAMILPSAVASSLTDQLVDDSSPL